MYKSSLDYFALALKYESNSKLKDGIKIKMKELLDRAEYIKHDLLNKNAKCQNDIISENNNNAKIDNKNVDIINNTNIKQNITEEKIKKSDLK